jgi:hypothetical protein
VTAAEEPVPGPGRRVEANGVDTYYEIDGEGEPVVLLHGGFVTVDSWAPQRAALAARHRLYLPERRGHGRTPDVDGPLSYAVMAADTIAFMDAVGFLPSAHLVRLERRRDRRAQVARGQAVDVCAHRHGRPSTAGRPISAEAGQ